MRSSDGKEVALSRWRGKPVILFYEDCHSTTLHSPLKEALFERGQDVLARDVVRARAGHASSRRMAWRRMQRR
ncbi:MAG: hypothetical protein ACXU86_12675 [Archangium sp.]